MQQAWRDAFAEVECRNSQARLAAPDPRVHNTGRKHKEGHEYHEDQEALTPVKGGRETKATHEERTSRRSAHKALRDELPTPSWAPPGSVEEAGAGHNMKRKRNKTSDIKRNKS